VLYVPGLNKNFILVSSMEEKSFFFSLLFREGKYSYTQRNLSQATQWSLGLEKTLYIGYKAILFRG
jgi:hypothetical protein